MGYPASEKLEIIRLVEQSHLPMRRRRRGWGSSLQGSTAVAIDCRPADQKRWMIGHQGRSTSGTASAVWLTNG